MYRFIESISFKNGDFLHIDYHNRRMNQTLKRFYNLKTPYFLENQIKIPKDLENNTLYKCRLVYSDKIEQISFTIYKPKIINSVQLIDDNEMDYEFKFENRKIFEKYLSQNDSDEIILVKNGFITDSSYSNLIFFDGNQWFTPNTFLLNGTQRQFLLENKLILEKQIKPEDLVNFTSFKLINAMLTFENSPILPTSIIKI